MKSEFHITNDELEESTKFDLSLQRQLYLLIVI